jgi:D-alanine-D-alanine ligase
MRISILTYLEGAGAERDPVVGQVADALRQGGHKVGVIGIYDDVSRLNAALKRGKPDLVFNLMEMFGENVGGDIAVAGLLDLLGLPYTGGGPGELYLAQDKGLTKKALAFDNVLFPDFAVFSKNADFETGGKLRMPLFVKPLRGDASIGIDGNALVHETSALMKRVLAIHEQCDDAALVEEYIDGRELYVSILGNREPKVFPAIELDFSGLPQGRPRVMSARAKWDQRSVEYKGTRSVVAELPDELRARVEKVSLDAYRALRVRDYGRIDLRVADTGDIFVIEVNPNCYLERASEFPMAASAGGLDYVQLINNIVDVAMERFPRRKVAK